VAGFVSGAYPNRGFLLRQTGENVKRVLSFYSSTSSIPPILRVTYTYTPPTIDPVVQQILNVSNPGTTEAQVVSTINWVVANSGSDGGAPLTFGQAAQAVLDFATQTRDTAAAQTPPVQNSCTWSVQAGASNVTVTHASATGALALVTTSDPTAPVYTGQVDGQAVTLTLYKGASQADIGSVLSASGQGMPALAQASLNGAVDGDQDTEVNATLSGLPVPNASALVAVGYKLQLGADTMERGVVSDPLTKGGAATGGLATAADCVHSSPGTQTSAQLNTAGGQLTIPGPDAAGASVGSYPSTTTAFRYRTFIQQATVDTYMVCGKFDGNNRDFSSYYDESNKTRASAFFNWPTGTIDTSKHVGTTHRYEGTYPLAAPPFFVHFSDKRKTASSNGIVFHDASMSKGVDGTGQYARIAITHAVGNPLCTIAGAVQYNIYVDAWKDGVVRVTGLAGKMPNHEAYVYPTSGAYGYKILQNRAPSYGPICLTFNCGQRQLDATGGPST
jgi:hypothetical protein